MDFLLGSLPWARLTCKSWPKKNGRIRADINCNRNGNLAWIVAGDPEISQWASVSFLKCVPLTQG